MALTVQSIYNSLSIYRVKLLAEVKDRSILKTMYDNILGNLEKFSPQKKESYIETLRIYIETNGKVHKTAAENFTHRNTINYRINKLSEILGVDLQSGEVRYLIQTAIYIKEFLELTENRKK